MRAKLFSTRKASLRDAKTLASLINEIFPKARANEATLLDKMSRETIFFIAEFESAPAGFIEITFRKTTAFIQGIGLKKQFEGKGVGSKLLERALKETKRKRKTSLLLTVKATNARALGFYKTRGFEPTKEKKGRTLGNIILKKTTEN